MSNLKLTLEKITVSQKQSYWKVQKLVEKFNSSEIVIPEYQRKFVWETPKQNRFIESIFLNVPIPPIFLFKKDKELELIDGLQRLTTIQKFVNGSLRLKEIQSIPELNMVNYSNLDYDIQQIFMNRDISVIIVNDEETLPEIQFEVFGRLNQGSVSLNSQELRNCIYFGEFNTFLNSLNKGIYRELLSPFSKFQQVANNQRDTNRLADVELILRFFSLLEFFNPIKNEYPDPKAALLNKYMRVKMGKEIYEFANPNKEKDELEKIFFKSCQLVKSVFKGNHFRKFSIGANTNFGNFNQAIFDVQMLVFVDYEIEEILSNEDIIYETFLDLSSFNADFIKTTTYATGSQITQRMGIWKGKIREILNNPQLYKDILNLKTKLFNENPNCSYSDTIIETIDDSFIYNNKLYKREYFREINLNKSERVKKKINLTINEAAYEVESKEEAIALVLDTISSNLVDNIFDINRFLEFSFIGTMKDFQTGNIPLTRFKKLQILNEQNQYLYIQYIKEQDLWQKIIQITQDLFNYIKIEE